MIGVLGEAHRLSVVGLASISDDSFFAVDELNRCPGPCPEHAAGAGPGNRHGRLMRCWRTRDGRGREQWHGMTLVEALPLGSGPIEAAPDGTLVLHQHDGAFYRIRPAREGQDWRVEPLLTLAQRESLDLPYDADRECFTVALDGSLVLAGRAGSVVPKARQLWRIEAPERLKLLLDASQWPTPEFEPTDVMAFGRHGVVIGRA